MKQVPDEKSRLEIPSRNFDPYRFLSSKIEKHRSRETIAAMTQRLLRDRSHAGGR
jgi:hypothetical protein